ncbi:hypothetical protein QF000_001352 [Paraburkholderia atlantica]
MRKRLGGGHIGGGGQIAQRQRTAGGNEGQQEFAGVVERADAALSFRIAELGRVRVGRVRDFDLHDSQVGVTSASVMRREVSSS